MWHINLLRILIFKSLNQIKWKSINPDKNIKSHTSQPNKSFFIICIPSILYQFQKLLICCYPHIQWMTADIIVVTQLRTIMVYQILKINSIDKDHCQDGYYVQPEQPEIANHSSSIVFEILLNGSLPPIFEGSLDRLIAAWTAQLKRVRLTRNSCLLMQLSECVIRRVLERFVCSYIFLLLHQRFYIYYLWIDDY